MSLLADLDLDEVEAVSLHAGLFAPLLSRRKNGEYVSTTDMDRMYLCRIGDDALVITDAPKKALKLGATHLVPLLTHLSPDEELLTFDEEPDTPFMTMSARALPEGMAIEMGRFSQLDPRQEFLYDAVSTAVKFVEGVV